MGTRLADSDRNTASACCDKHVEVRLVGDKHVEVRLLGDKHVEVRLVGLRILAVCSKTVAPH
jgi:hypothetical protein